MIILYYSGFFFSFNIYSAELPTLSPHQSKQEYPQLSVKRLSTGSSVPQGKVHLRGTDGRQNTATDKRPFLTCTPGPGCQAPPPTLAQCEWPWKMGKDRDSSLSSSCMNGAPKAKGPALKSLEEFICGINCPWTPVLMDGRDGAPVRVTVAKAAQLCDLRRKTIWPKPIIS